MGKSFADINLEMFRQQSKSETRKTMISHISLRPPGPRVLCFAKLAFVVGFGALGGSVSAVDLPRPKMQIINGTNQTVDIFWLKTASERVSNGSLEPGKSTTIVTTLGHRFTIVGRGDRSESTVVSEVVVQAFRVGGIPAFYTQRIEAHGFPIVASANVNPYALKEAAYLLDLMLAKRPDVREAMIKSGARLSILAWNEFTTDQPEWKWLADQPMASFPGISGTDYYDARARGMGGSETDPYCSCAEENLLCYPGDPYSTENILIHEFAHNIHLRGMVNVDPTFDGRLKVAHDAAMNEGLWKGKYASVNHHEYFAEGVQSWFDNNRENDHDHNHVNTREELLEYDPRLAALCREVFGDTELKYTKPQTRLTGHLAGYDPATAPKFEWPERLSKAKDEIRRHAKARDAAANASPPRGPNPPPIEARSPANSPAQQTGKPIASIQYQQRDISGWQVHINNKLLETELDDTQHALTLLKKMLDDIARVVPEAAVAELRAVPLYFSPAYEARKSGAEYHPEADWLRQHGRDPAMARGVEFSGVADFEAEMNRMPNFALHELAHAYHHRVLDKGFDNSEIQAAFEVAKAAGKYERVERWHGNGKPNTFERAYAMTNPMEYFAESTEAFFARNDFYPFTRDELKRHDSEMCGLLARLWGATEVK